MDVKKNMKKEPLVSVLMGAYNEEEWISKAIESILKQTYRNFEFIIVNDGSKDKTLEILRDYEKKDKRIKVINNKKNIGLTKSLNAGLKKCKGKYIARMDADNVSMNNRLSLQVKFLENNLDYVLVGSWREDVFDDGKKRILKFPLDDIQIKKKLMSACVISHSSVMIRGDIIKKYKYDENFRTSQDYELWMRLGKKYKFANLKKVLTNAYYRKKSITRTKKKLQTLKLQTLIRVKGYKHLNIPWWYFVYIIKPTIEMVIPNNLINKYVDWKMRK